MNRILFIFFLIVLTTQTGICQNQSLKIFGTKIKAKEITGIKKFNDFGTKSNTSVINDLTDDLNTYYWRLGTVRKNKKDYTDGLFSLFDLSNYNYSPGYPILDSIDFKYYEEVGFVILEKRDSLLINNYEYKKFKSSFSSLNLQDKRNLIWADSNLVIRNLLFRTKYHVNVQKINNDVVKQLTKNISDTLKVDFTKILKGLNLSANVESEISGYLNNKKNEDIKLNGEYVSIIFQPRYIKLASYVIGGLDIKNLDSNDEFNNNLIQYIELNQKNILAFNSALYGFRLNGNYDLVELNSRELSNNTSLSLLDSEKISNEFNLEVKRSINRNFQNEFNKIWIIMFATDADFGNLSFDRKILK